MGDLRARPQARADAQAKANEGRGWYAVLARTGLVAKGSPSGSSARSQSSWRPEHGGKATSRQGALQDLAHTSFGKIVLILLACGFAAYALWRFIQACAERPSGDDGEAKVWGKRAGYVGRGLIYAGLTYSTVRILVGSGGGQSQNAKAHQSTAVVLKWPGGTWIVGIAGVVLIGVALWNLYRGLSRKFEDKWRVNKLSPGVRRWGSARGRRRPRCTLRRLRSHRRLRRQGRRRLQAERRDRPRRRIAEAGARLLRAVAARADRGRARRVRRVTVSWTRGCGTCRRTADRWTRRIAIWVATHRIRALNEVFVALGDAERLGSSGSCSRSRSVSGGGAAGWRRRSSRSRPRLRPSPPTRSRSASRT